MRAIGFRANPNHVTYAVVEGEASPLAEDFTVVSTGAVPVPKALWVPEQLHFIRTVLLDVMDDLEVTRAGIRLTESVALSRSEFRDNIEGVIQELLASSTVESYVAGGNGVLSARLGLSDKKLFKQYCKGEKAPEFAKGWATLKLEQREAVLAAIASLRSESVASSTTIAIAGMDS